jgi:hypothetical protein
MSARRSHVTRLAAVLAIVVLSLPLSATARVLPDSSSTKQEAEGDLTADLDGKPIALADVGHWYCHDFDYPAIHCFSDPGDIERSTEFQGAAAAATAYVTVYEFTTYQGAFMHMSQDYTALTLIGWNDRISSFVVHNSAGGAFWTDWLYSGTRYSFCCFQQLGSLGGYNDTFSSVFHN